MPRSRHSMSNSPAATRRGRPSTGRAQSAAERMRRYRARKRTAAKLNAPARALAGGALQHRILEARSLAMHCVIARKIDANPRLLAKVRQTLASWCARYGADRPRVFDEWQAILREPWPVVAALITDGGERATRLRQSTPFAGVLTAQERERLYAAFRP